MSVKLASKTLSRQIVPSITNPWLRPYRYKENDIITVKLLEANAELDVRIVKPFTPFSNSVALLVNPVSPFPGLPRQLVLKLADRRLGDRWIYQPWSSDLESNFQQSLRRFVHRSRRPKPKKRPSALLGELNMWKSTQALFDRECEAYRRLTQAQTFGYIPKLYAHVCIPMSSKIDHPSTRHIDGLLLEYIPGPAMDSIRVGLDISIAEAEGISQKVIQLGRNLRQYGVTHGDIRPGNIILSSVTNEPVLIDWGLAGFHIADSPSLEERWNELNVRQNFEKDIRWALKLRDEEGGDHQFWHRLSTPLSNEQWALMVEAFGGDAQAFRDVNERIAIVPKAELDAFYEEDANIDESEGLRWRVKPGIRVMPIESMDPPSYD